MKYMDEIQSWWEVPVVAHFCYVFRAAFNLFYIEVAELEAAILNVQDPEMCMSLEQLITRLLQGYYDDESVTSENWERKLFDLFSEKCCRSDTNPLVKNFSFSQLSPRDKVEILLKLCEYRLDANDALEAIKDIPPETMKAKCIGKDSENNSYWYFCDERLYKEIPSNSTQHKKKNLATSKESKKKSPLTKNGRRQNKEKTSSLNVDNSWSVVCHTLSDWEALVKLFSKRKKQAEKDLVNIIKNEYLPMLQDVVSEKSRLLRKRFLELAPKRTSSRLSKVQAQRKIEEQRTAEAAEKSKIEFEQEQARREVEKKKKEIEDRKKRVEERHKAIEERARRAEQRRQTRYRDESPEVNSRVSRTKRIINRRKNYCRDSDSSSDTSGDESKAEDSVSSNSDSISGSESNNSDKSDSECESDSESENPQFKKERNSRTVKKQVVGNTLNKTQFTNSSVKNSFEFSNWNSTVDSKGRKLHILHSDYDELSSKKRFKSSEDKDFRNDTLRDIKSSFINEKIVLKSFHDRNFNSYSRVTPSPSIIRLNFLKPPSKEISSEFQI